MPVVEVRDLVKRYEADGPNAVDHLSFEIEEGEIFSLLGPNGAGKTTTIAVISTLLRPTAGHVVVNGFDVSRDPMGVRRSIGVVPQEIALYDDLSAEENLRFWGEMRGLGGAQLRREVDEKLEMTGLTGQARSRVKTFSGGMKRRLNIAVGLLGSPPLLLMVAQAASKRNPNEVGLLGSPPLLLMDEPTVGIDPQSRRYILDWVKRLNEAGTTILYTTHYMEEAQELSDRIGIIDHGRLIALGTLEALIRQAGAQETLILRVAREEDAPRLLDMLRPVEGVEQADRRGDRLTLNVRSASAVLPRLLKRAEEAGIAIRTIDIREPNLEAVFLHLTGRALRD